ncbi:MAG: insulinase family protein, partial [Kiritimatiellae bacterium]|nr:insulinase family protein [Kiritimatiellia bacterium]
MTTEKKDLKVGEEYRGFRITKITPLPALRVTAYELEHATSGAHLLHLHTEDTENCFAVTFPTPPENETGLPHIMEHSVLAGSKKYPVHEPFFEMVKISMATFINALTAQMFTVYPIATTVKKDFFNLADVYMDAIFHPNITAETFRAEGHHLTLADNNDLSSDLKISGIVYSEMKGYWSTPDNLISNLGTRGLFPDTPLHRDSGGNPDYIPELTYKQFKEFHEKYYHPSNALFYIYGDIPTKEHLDFLEPLLQPFTRKEITVPMPYQPRWTEPRQIKTVYPIGETEELENNTYIVMDWLVADAADPADSVEWSILSNILLGNEAAPLKKAIIDSRLGADIYPSGDFAHAHELVFEVGIKGSEENKVADFSKLVKETLLEIASNPIPSEQIEAAFHQLAYHHLEVSTLFPIKLLWLCEETWPYGKDPLEFLQMDIHIADCKKRYIEDPDMFNRLITEKLLNNPHQITL